MFALGACLGSFFNVLIYRLPREESIVRPASRCPTCGRPVRAWENVPIVSFLLLRGKCAGCGGGISWRYPAVEAASGVGFFLIAWADGLGFSLLRDLVFFSLLVPIVFIDIDHRIIPDELSLGGLAAGIFLSFLPGGDWHGSLAGALLGGGLLYVTAATYHRVTGIEGLGGGDMEGCPVHDIRRLSAGCGGRPRRHAEGERGLEDRHPVRSLPVRGRAHGPFPG